MTTNNRIPNRLVYDYSKSSNLTPGSIYCISGKVNAADKLYLILEHHKIDKNFNQSNLSVVNEKNEECDYV